MSEIMHTLLSEYLEIENELESLEYLKNQLRQKIQTEVLTAGGAIEIPGLGSAQITPSSVSHSYDTKALDNLLAESVAAGDIHTAQRLTDARKSTTRKESLRITKSK